MNIEHGPDYEHWSREKLIRALKDNDVEHQEFRLQNDREWREKLDYQKALIRELVAALWDVVCDEDELGYRKQKIAHDALAKAKEQGYEP